MPAEMTRKRALAKHENCNCGDIEVSQYDDKTFCIGQREYLVLTDEEAHEKVEQNILDSVWAFRPEFLECFMPEGVTTDVIKLLQEKCESANPALLSMLGDRKDNFVRDAIRSDGRGHFLNQYDGNEDEVRVGKTYLYIYRLN